MSPKDIEVAARQADSVVIPNPSLLLHNNELAPTEHTSLLHGHGSKNASECSSATAIEIPGEPSGSSSINGEEAADQQLSTREVAGIISLLLIGVFLSNVDATLIFAIYGTISSEFDALGAGSWLSTSYFLASCAAQPLMGKLSDIYGRKPVITISYALFAIGSVICGVAQNMSQAIVGRVIAGTGAAGMSALVSIIITDLVPLIQIAAWRSYVNVLATVGRSIGGPLGGFLADTIGWRWSFIGQAPLIAIAIVLVNIKLPAEPHRSQRPQKGEPSKLRRIDFIGALVLAIAIVCFLGALSLGGQALLWSNPIIIGLIVASVASSGFFIYFEKKFALEPVFPPSLLADRDVATSYAITLLQTIAQLAMMFSIPLYFQVTRNASNTSAGSALFPAVLGNTAGGLLTGYLIQRTGRYKVFASLATISSSVSYILLIVLWKGKTSTLEGALEIIPGGFGQGMAGSATFMGLTAGLQQSDMAIGTAGMYLVSSIGMVMGTAMSSTVQRASLTVLLQDRLGPEREDIAKRVLSDTSAIWEPGYLTSSLRTTVIRSYVASLEYSHVASLVCAFLALLISFTIREKALK